MVKQFDPENMINLNCHNVPCVHVAPQHDVVSLYMVCTLTSDPLAHVATMALHDKGGLFGRKHGRPCSLDINSSSGDAAWHSYKTMCCIYGMLPGESNTGSYCTIDN